MADMFRFFIEPQAIGGMQIGKQDVVELLSGGTTVCPTWRK